MCLGQRTSEGKSDSVPYRGGRSTTEDLGDVALNASALVADIDDHPRAGSSSSHRDGTATV